MSEDAGALSILGNCLVEVIARSAVLTWLADFARVLSENVVVNDAVHEAGLDHLLYGNDVSVIFEYCYPYFSVFSVGVACNTDRYYCGLVVLRSEEFEEAQGGHLRDGIEDLC